MRYARYSDSQYMDLVKGEKRTDFKITVPAQGFLWLQRINEV